MDEGRTFFLEPYFLVDFAGSLRSAKNARFGATPAEPPAGEPKFSKLLDLIRKSLINFSPKPLPGLKVLI